MVKGIGPHFARKLVRAFGEEVFDVIEREPDRLLELEGIGPKRKERVTSALAEQKVVREIMVRDVSPKLRIDPSRHHAQQCVD